jgi:nucleoid DNA-binding protein
MKIPVYSKKSLIKDLAAKLQISPAVVEEVIVSAFELIGHQVSEQKAVQIYGFGTFKPSLRKARNGRNPYSGEPMVIEPKYSIKFNVSSKIKEAINKK